MKTMRAYIIISLLLLSISTGLQAQIGINNDNSPPDASAMLDIKSTDKGILIPRLTTMQRTMVDNPATGLLIFDTDTAGFWFFNGVEWENLSVGGSTATELTDTDGDTKIQAEATPDEDKIRFKINGSDRFIMEGARLEFINHISSIYLGEGAGNISSDLQAGNIGIGNYTLGGFDFGARNVAIGNHALGSLNSGSSNIAIGENAGISLASNDENILIGKNAGTLGGNLSRNVFIGTESGFNNNGTGNIFIGHNSGYNESGSNRLIINNSNSSTPLIYGDFGTETVQINGELVANTFIGDGSGLTNLNFDNLDVNDADADPANEIQNLSEVLSESNDAGGQDINNLGAVIAGSFSGDGSGLTNLNVSGDNMGDHIATTDINLNGNRIVPGNSFLSDSGLSMDQYGSLIIDSYPYASQLKLRSGDSPAIAFLQTDAIGYGEELWTARGGSDEFSIGTSDGTPFKLIAGSSSDRIFVDGDYVGIGNDSPSQELDVNGKIRMRFGAVDGYIPVSDNQGVLTWTDPSSLNGLPTNAPTGSMAFFNGSSWAAIPPGQVGQTLIMGSNGMPTWSGEGLPQVSLPNGDIIYVYPENLSTNTTWGDQTVNIAALPDITSSSQALMDFNGATNTQAIVDELQNYSGGEYAARYCADLVAYGYSDWYLPAAGELQAVYQQLGPGGSGEITSGIYWSSTEYITDLAWEMRFSDGLFFEFFKIDNDDDCLCVRK